MEISSSHLFLILTEWFLVFTGFIHFLLVEIFTQKNRWWATKLYHEPLILLPQTISLRGAFRPREKIVDQKKKKDQEKKKTFIKKVKEELAKKKQKTEKGKEEKANLKQKRKKEHDCRSRGSGSETERASHLRSLYTANYPNSFVNHFPLFSSMLYRTSSSSFTLLF